ncbi:hypothetical protein C6P46_000758 [Rhodotorula mucilaginosa]|uniref:Uncharacterized protein n=1 Tax=Rhodotorula mucilaginosa TaxID=5537 RepID=A0A9P6VW54_RHOMI|nr:hypothetical protein C6P46_000758 [Rhodotorula mucilaginosa]TKA51360.1 hypothetical protein B0A53_05291 [Rhodotorula sp. CCFEE 5036]
MSSSLASTEEIFGALSLDEEGLGKVLPISDLSPMPSQGAAPSVCMDEQPSSESEVKFAGDSDGDQNEDERCRIIDSFAHNTNSGITAETDGGNGSDSGAVALSPEHPIQDESRCMTSPSLESPITLKDMLDFLHLDEEGLPKVLPIIDLSPMPPQGTASVSMPLLHTNDKSNSESEETSRDPDGDGDEDGNADKDRYTYEDGYEDPSAWQDGYEDAQDSIVVDDVAADLDGGAGGVGSLQKQKHAVHHKGE